MIEAVKRTWGFLALGSVCLVGIAWIGCLFLGDPQWHKSIYLFRARIWPACGEGGVPIPQGYTGTWVCWLKNGRTGTYSIKCGRRDGEFEVRYMDGRLLKQGYYEDGRIDGILRWWHDNGVLGACEVYADGVFTREKAQWDTTGRLEFRSTPQDDGTTLLEMRLAEGCFVKQVRGGSQVVIQESFSVDGAGSSREDFWREVQERKKERPSGAP